MKSLEWLGGKLRFIDQTKLPAEEIYIVTDDHRIVGDAIHKLSIRGAPALGVAAAYGAALAAFENSNENSASFKTNLTSAINELKSTRPTAVNLSWSLERINKVLDTFIISGVELTVAKIIDEAINIHDEDIAMCNAIGINGAEIIPQDATILTHCNTGALATGGDGTAQNVIVTAHTSGKNIKVYAGETRPLLQGARLTVWELMKLGIDVTLITDSTAAFLMQQKKIDLVITGADRITMQGFVANKVGTYNLAVNAKMHGIPFYIAAPTSTIDTKIEFGDEIIIEERSENEITEYFGKRTAPVGVKVYSPAFDITPPDLITGIITDRKIFLPPYSHSLSELK
ncbi:MAG: S-methyl-5-thioribose-1-phosphate isomerase [Bacteroidota bacterium]|nr:S-methyl-5-thioribose-1-phosphate isomerase [Bacteroidota bacterium]